MDDQSIFELDNLRHVILQYKIPLAFDVENSFKEEDAGNPYITGINGVPAKIHLERIYDFRYKNDFQMAPFSKMPEDRSAMLSYTQVQVWFDHQTFDSILIDKNKIDIYREQFLDLSIEYLNKFIKSYKLLTKEYWLRPIIRKDIINYQYIQIDSAGNDRNFNMMIPAHHMIQFNGGKEFKLDDSIETILRHDLTTDQYNFRNELILEMRNNFSLGYYNIALLQAITIFENFVYSMLNKHLSKTRLNRIKKKEECGCIVGISEVCVRGINQYFDVDFGEMEQYKNLKEQALKYRNLIVHGELLEQMDPALCQKGIDAVYSAEIFLYEHVFKDLADE